MQHRVLRLTVRFSEAFFLTKINKCMPEVFMQWAWNYSIFHVARKNSNYVETHLFTLFETVESIKTLQNNMNDDV